MTKSDPKGTVTTKDEYLLTEIEFRTADAVARRLSRIDAFLGKHHTKQALDKQIFKVVREGLKRVGRNTALQIPGDNEWRPVVEITCPFASFGKIETADRREIERYLGIHALIRNYYADTKSDKPFSLATFGPPGSGKNFGIKSIIESIDPEAAKSPLEFNVASLRESKT